MHESRSRSVLRPAQDEATRAEKKVWKKFEDGGTPYPRPLDLWHTIMRSCFLLLFFLHLLFFFLKYYYLITYLFFCSCAWIFPFSYFFFTCLILGPFVDKKLDAIMFIYKTCSCRVDPGTCMQNLKWRSSLWLRGLKRPLVRS